MPVRRVPCSALPNVAVRYARFVLLWWSLLLGVSPAYAGTVAIVRPTNPGPDAMEARSRVHGELLSVGLDVKLIVRPPDRDPSRADARAWLEQIAAEGQIDAVIDITDDATLVAADIWVIEKAPARIELSRIALGPKTRNSAEMLAIRAVEVLRSTFLERDMAARQQRTEPTATPRPVATPKSLSFPHSEHRKRSNDPQRFGIELGAAALTSLDGVGPAILPLARADWRVRTEFMVQATFAGLGTRPTVANAEGSAKIAQQYAIIGGWFGLHSHGRMRPHLALSAGAVHTSVAGHADSPRQGHRTEQWALLTEGSIGLGFRLTDSHHLALAAHAQLAVPYLAIHILDSVVATTGRPSFGLTLTVGAWL